MPVKSYRNVAFAVQSLRLEIILEAQCTREVKLWQTCYEIGEENSKIVPLGAPLLNNKTKSFI